MKSKTTKRALLGSVIVMLLCLAMLIGSTFAWFTDSSATAVNTIQAGNLDVVVQYKKAGADDWNNVTSATKLFDDSALWEPGHTEVAYLKVKNGGSLALDYKLAVNVISETPGENESGESFNLSDYLVFGKKVTTIFEEVGTRGKAWTDAGSVKGLNTYSNEEVLYPETAGEGKPSEQYIALIVYMPTDVGNVANYRNGKVPSISLGVNLYATQTEYEYDSFGNDYDATAKTGLPTVAPYTATSTVTGGADTVLKVEGKPVSVTVPKDTVTANTVLQLVVEPKVEAYTGVTVDIGGKVASYDIKVVDTATGAPVTGTAPEYTVNLNVGKNLEDVKVFHNGVAVTGAAYDAGTGIVTFKTSSFSQFDVTYKETWQSNASENYETSVDETAKTVTIKSAEELALLAMQVNSGTSYQGYTVNLEADINLDGKAWTPIGKAGKPFKGIFDGKNHTISNLLINTPGASDVGLFGYTTDGEVKNLTLCNASIRGYLDVGTIAGTPYTSKYTNITLRGKVSVDGFAYVGGMFGKNAYANLTDLTIDVTDGSYVKADSQNYRTYVGGVVGFMGEGGHCVTNVTSNIDVIGTTCDVGGITGIAHYGNSFINCSSSGNVTLTGAQDAGDELEIGGIAGVWHNENGTSVTLTNCRYTGTLSSHNVSTGDATEFPNNGIVGRQYSTSGTGTLIIN